MGGEIAPHISPRQGFAAATRLRLTQLDSASTQRRDRLTAPILISRKAPTQNENKLVAGKHLGNVFVDVGQSLAFRLTLVVDVNDLLLDV